MTSNRNLYKKGRLTARPVNLSSTITVEPGLQALNVQTGRDGLIYVPAMYSNQNPSSLAVLLHGAGGQAEHGLHLLRQYADLNNIVLLAPASRETTWDIIARNSFDADVIFIDQALTGVFNRFNIDPDHIALGGFSDGASYALSLGLSNGDLFTHLIAFSPGFFYTIENNGKPPVFISHGIHDRVLPIEPCSRRIVPRLKKLGYAVNYREFDGEHEIPSNISGNAIDWFMQ